MESRVRYCGKPAEHTGTDKAVSGDEVLALFNNCPRYDNDSDKANAEEKARKAKKREDNEEILSILQDRFGLSKIAKVETSCFNRYDEVCVEVRIWHALEETRKLRGDVRHIVADVLYNGGDIEEDTSCGYYDKGSGKWLETDSDSNNGTWRDIGAKKRDWNEAMDSLTGLANAKAKLKDLIDVAKGRSERGGSYGSIKNVFTFEGNPGCGKTMVAKYFANCLKSAKVITSDDPFHDVSVSDLIAGYTGQTVGQVSKVFRDYSGSVIFIDEAYSIAQTAEYGKEAINQIVKCISDMEENTVLIMAGYPDSMTEFLKVNPGLESRVSERVLFDDYSLDELLDILENNLKLCHIFYIKESAEKIRAVFAETLRAVSFNSDENCGRSIGNARAIDNLIKKIELYHTRDVRNRKKDNPGTNIFDLRLETAEKVRDEVIKQSRESGTALGAVKPPYLVSPEELKGNTFDGIIGNENAKNELIRQAEIMKKIGNNDNDSNDSSADITNGILLVGYPGCGKTALARAFANEVAKDGAKVAFVVPDINTLLTDSAAIGKLFNDIQAFDRCVLFLDEVDTVGTERTYLNPSSAQFTALMTLLTKLDGFKKKGGLFVLSATNHPEMLDPAIRRRLGTEIKIELPNEEERILIIKKYIGDKEHNISSEEFEKLSSRVDGRSGANIETIVKNALKKTGNEPLTSDMLLESINNDRMGYKSNILVTPEERRRIAVHEMGHAVIQLMLNPDDMDVAVYMEQRTGGMLGYTESAGYSGNCITYSQMLKKIKMMLGGKAAEEVFYGNMGVSSSCSADLKSASEIAVGMISQYGMGKSILVRADNDPVVLKEADELLKDCYSSVRKMLVSVKDKIACSLEYLESNDVLSNSKLREICNIQYIIITDDTEQ